MRHDASFVVRIWWERSDQGTAPLWRGYVQHAQSQEAVYFNCTESLLAFLQHWAGDLAPVCDAAILDSTAEELK